MSGKLMGEVFALKLSQGERLVLLALADHAADNGTGARPGIRRICWKTDLGTRTVERYLSNLRKAGIIEKVGGGGNNLAVEYKINLSAGKLKPAFTANDETESTAENGNNQPPSGAGEANHSAAVQKADEGKSAIVHSAAIQKADEQPNILPEKVHSAAVSGIIQPPKPTHSAALATAAQPLTVREPLPLPPKRRALNFPETVKSEVGKTRARETAAAEDEVFNFWKAAFNSPKPISKGFRQEIKKKFSEGFTVADLKAAIRGYKIAAPEEDHNTKHSGNFRRIMRDVEKFRRFDSGK